MGRIDLSRVTKKSHRDDRHIAHGFNRGKIDGSPRFQFYEIINKNRSFVF